MADSHENHENHDRGLRLLIVVVYSLALIVAVGATLRPAHAQEVVTADDIEGWIAYYSEVYATPTAPYDWLVANAERVARCESAQFDQAVINNARRGRLGEVGVGQFHPRGLWWSSPQAIAGYSMFDPEANTAALVWGISRGYGPTAWYWCWRNG